MAALPALRAVKVALARDNLASWLHVHPGPAGELGPRARTTIKLALGPAPVGLSVWHLAREPTVIRKSVGVGITAEATRGIVDLIAGDNGPAMEVVMVVDRRGPGAVGLLVVAAQALRMRRERVLEARSEIKAAGDITSSSKVPLVGVKSD